MAGLGEFAFIERLLRPLAAGYPGALDLTDDAALVDVPDGCQLVIAKDAMVEGVHYLPDDPPDLIAGKLLRVNVSDLAAMGADPLGYLTVLARPKVQPSARQSSISGSSRACAAQAPFTTISNHSRSTSGEGWSVSNGSNRRPSRCSPNSRQTRSGGSFMSSIW